MTTLWLIIAFVALVLFIGVPCAMMAWGVADSITREWKLRPRA